MTAARTLPTSAKRVGKSSTGMLGDSEAIDGTDKDLYEREEWTLFRSVRTISQKSGVPPELLRRLVAKELADNALDASGNCRVGDLPDGGFFVEDDGPGISGEPDDIARLFSFRRPLVSSKVKRLPTRGALGNGLRVIAAAVFASNGRLCALTRGQALELSPQESGETLVVAKPCDRRTGTRIEVRLGDAIPDDPDFLAWAETAIRASGQKPIYAGKTSPWFYDSDSFFEFLKAAGTRSVRDVMQDFDGSSGRRNGVASHFPGRAAASLTYDESEQLLRFARAQCKQVQPNRLTLLKDELPGSYAKALDTLDLDSGRGSFGARLPYTVEAWCMPSRGDDEITMLVNRSPVTGEVDVQRAAEKADVHIFGCNLGHRFTVGKKPICLTINVQIPYMPITSTGKEPDLELFLDSIREAVERAAAKCQRANRCSEDRTGSILPSQRKGRPNDEDKARYAADLARFADLLKEIKSTFDFKVSSRGWCYILENDHGLSKGDFDKAQNTINECRKTGLLPVDFTTEDESRGADNLEKLDTGNPALFASALVRGVLQWKHYTPFSFWDNQPVYIQMVVEKIDLKHLFCEVCDKYRVPIINSRGWSDLNLRAGLMRRFKEHEAKGRKPFLLYCGDHDPVGLQIPDLLLRHLEELAKAVGWSPRNLTIERFGLNAEFIEQHGLTWIDGLQTGSGKDLGSTKHKHHYAAHVQQYIRTFGKQKVEANALVVRPEAGRKLCRDAIEKHLNPDAIAAYEEALVLPREHVRAALPAAIEQQLKALQESR